ncbi:MAG: DPP IV N-terminal domain-containing protein, partial [Chitinophagaceae bacterium]
MHSETNLNGKLLVVLIMLFPAFVSKAQYKGALNLEDIYSNGTYSQKGFGPVRWMKDSKGYSTLEANKEFHGNDIVRYDVGTGERIVLVYAKNLIPEGSTEPLAIANYNWSDDGSKLLIFTNTRRVWRYNTRGDYWILNLKNGKLQQLGKSIESTTMMFAKFSPDATKVAYESKYNIYVEDLASGSITQVTHDGGGNIINGTFDWVYEEELDCRDGFRWSLDGKNIAYWQSDTKGIGTFYLINNIDSIYSVPIPLPYPKVGTTLSTVKVGVVAINGGKTKWFDMPGDAGNQYLARMDFVPNSHEVMIQQLNRTQDSNFVWMGDINTMKLKNILIESDKAFLDIHDNILWLDNGKYFTWSSEKDGWLHLYKVARDGKSMNLITKGDFDVVQISCIDTTGGYVYYIASPDNYTQRYLYRSRMDGSGIAERVTPATMKGQSNYQVSSDAKWAIQTFQNVTTPPLVSLVQLPGHKTVKVLEENTALKTTFENLHLNPKQFFKIDIGDVKLDAWMIKPVSFDPAKKYPLLFYVYGEPAGSTVQDNWGGGDLWHQYMAQQGNIVISVDNRGTKTPRGRAWRKSIYQ